MIFPEVRSLYKYMPINENTLGCILKNEFWFSKPAFFNDPLDCGIQLLNHITKESLILILERDIHQKEKQSKYTNSENLSKVSNFLEKIKSIDLMESEDINLLNSEFKEIAETAIKKYSEEIQRIGILSLSEINNNILMWSHYAQQHQGICLEFERNESNILSNNNHTLPVRYSLQKPLISLSTEVLGDSKIKKEIRRSLIYTKSLDWNYEREWRVVVPEGNTASNINSPIKKIFFGVKTSESQKRTVEKIVDGKGIELREMYIKNDNFGLSDRKYEKIKSENFILDLASENPIKAYPFPIEARKRRTFIKRNDHISSENN
jgi:hypothetical protein